MYTGVLAFKGERVRRWIPALVAGAILFNNYIFGIIYFNAQIRISVNFLIVGGVYAACARTLFIRIEQPSRTAYWSIAPCRINSMRSQPPMP